MFSPAMASKWSAQRFIIARRSLRYSARLYAARTAVDHYGKDVAAGTRGSSAKAASADLVLACLGDREQSGSVTNTRLAVRKCRGGPQGQEFHFTVRKVEDPTPDKDGDPITTLVIEWTTGPTAPPPPKDP